MLFHGIYCQPGVATIKVNGLSGKFWLRSKLAPGKSEGQEHIYGDISRSATTEKGWTAQPAAGAKIKMACPITIGGYQQHLF